MVETEFRLTVNGAERSVTCEPDTPLLDVLRHDLGLAGPRFGCGMGLCGACFVLIEGRVRASCDMPVSAAARQVRGRHRILVNRHTERSRTEVSRAVDSTYAGLIPTENVAQASPRLIERGDLLAALDRAAARKVTIISAPAGSGKTSLLRLGRPSRSAAPARCPAGAARPARCPAVLAGPARRGP
jgi:hypothetical protein